LHRRPPHVGGSSCCLVAAMCNANFRGRINGAKCQSMTLVGEVTAEEGREKICIVHPAGMETANSCL
jgi:hypothetical protein